MTRSMQLIGASIAIGMTVAVLWFRAPLVPALIGAAGAGVVMYMRARRTTH
jgi:hypothetical protein